FFKAFNIIILQTHL
ncbi:hypothetical protein VCAG7404_001176B, partial [Vibrio cholerae O1 str. AG-7404]